MKNSGMSVKNFVKLGGMYQNETILQTNIQRFTASKEEEILLVRYFFLLTKTDFLPPEVYDILVKRQTYDDVTFRYGMSKSTLKNKIYNTNKKIFQELIYDPYACVMEHSLSTQEIHVLINHINRIIYNHVMLDNHQIQDQLLWDMEQYKVHADYGYHNKVNVTEFAKLVQLLRPISKPYLVKILGSMDKELLAYISYLISTPDAVLPDKSKEHKDMVRKMWWITEDDVNG